MNRDSQVPSNRARALAAIWVLYGAATVAATCATSVLACGTKSKPPSDLVVTSFTPSETAAGSEPLQLQFDQPVVAEERVGETLELVPVTIKPALEVEAHWLDRQTLVVTPKGEMKRSTTYKVTLSGDLGKRTGGFAFDFVHEPLEVEGIWGADLNQLPTLPTLPIHFNQAVRGSDVLARCKLQLKGDKTTISLVAADDTQSGEKIAVKPAAPLQKDQDYEFTCDKLKGDGGDAPMKTAYVQPLHTHAKFFVEKSQPDGQDVPADDVDIELVFSTPVSIEEVRKNISAKPAIVGISQGWLDRTATRYKATATLKTTTEYTITLSDKLKDSFDQKLDKPFKLSFTTGNARPRLSLETGIYALEPSAPGYPVWTRNVRDFDIGCANVPRAKIVGLLTSSLDYDPWYDAGSSQELDWKKLGLKKRAKRVAIDKPKDKWHLSNLVMHEICGGAKQHGLFLADIRSRDIEPDDEYPWRYRPHRRILANVTDLGILLKAGTGSGIVWVARISDGKPVPGASITIYTPQGRLAHRGNTDKDGILRIPGTTQLLRKPGADDRNEFDDGEDFYSYRSQRMIAIVSKGDDLAVVDGNWANGIQTWNFGVREDRRSGRTRIRGFIQSDRGIYRPGETVHFKGLVREIAVGKAPVVPQRAKIKIQVEDSRGQNVFDKSMRLSEFGGFSFDLPLTVEANLGDYYVSATIKGQTFRERFSVEEFRKVSFELDLEGNERHGRIGDKLRFKVNANYLFGAPVADAEVEWNVQRRSHTIHFPKYSQYSFGDYASRGWYYYDRYDYDYDDHYLSFVSEGQGATNRRGSFRFSMRDPRTDFDGPQDYVVGVTVRDETDQVVSKRTVVTAHKTDFYLGLHTQEYVQAVDMPFAVNTVALSPSGERVATKATLKFIRETYDCSYSGGYRSYRSCKTKHEVELERAIDIPQTGTGTERIMPKKPGEYVVRIEATDGRGNKVVSSGSIWVIGKGEAFWSGDESARMALVASKDKYKPGDTARLVPRTGLKNASALVTLERNGIIDAFVKPMASSADGIEIPLTDVHAPNVFASVAMVTGRTGKGDRHRPRFKMGIAELKVSPDNKRLEVVVETEKDSYQPGEIVNGTVRVTTKGVPVKAEVSVSVADEGVLQLIAYKTPDPMNAFYASWGLGVDASTNWNRISRLNDPSAGDPDQGGDGGGGEDDSVRSNFVSSAFWAPSLITDDKGEVKFSYTAPDNLTAFRTMAVAADTGSRFGSGESRITVKKPLLAKPVLPRFLNTGDKARVGVVVHNYTGKEGKAVVNATAKGAYLSRKTREVRLAKDGTARVSFPVKVTKSREATFEFSVEMDGHRDALRLGIPVNRPLLIDKKTVAAGIMGREGAETTTIPVTWDSSLVANRSMVSITVDRTGLGELEPSLRYLIQYPYGCLEQTLSRFIPLTKVKDLAKSLKMKELEGAKLKSFIRAGVAKVARHQHADGHFSLWPSGSTYPHLTVYAIYGLTEAKRAGVKVPDEVIKRGLRAIKSWSAKQSVSPGGDSATMAMAAYVLAELGQPDAGLNSRLFEGRRALPRYGLAFLARAMKRSKARAADLATVKDEIIGAATVDGLVALIRETDTNLSHYMSSDTRTSAITLSALLEIDPKNPMIDKLAAGLKKKQRPGGHWSNTQDNLYALVALSDYARSQSAGSELVTLYINGKQQVRRRLKGANVLHLRRWLHNYKPGDIKIETTGKVRYAVRMTEAREDPADTPVDKGFTITRQYLDPGTGTPLTEFKTGQLIKVRVEVKSQSGRRYVAVEDPLPAGFEAVNTKLATSADTSGAKTNTSWGWTHREMRDDRILGFIDNMYRNSIQMEYLARATIPGTFVAPPARVEEMYTPEVNGRSTSVKVVIKKK